MAIVEIRGIGIDSKIIANSKLPATIERDKQDSVSVFSFLQSCISSRTFYNILLEFLGYIKLEYPSLLETNLNENSTGGSPEYRKLLDEMWTLHCNKNAGYSGKDIDRWANFRLSEKVGVPAWKGALIRLSDKFIRVCNLAKDPNMDKVGEGIRDTLVDLAAYALIIVCLLDELKEKE